MQRLTGMSAWWNDPDACCLAQAGWIRDDGRGQWNNGRLANKITLH